MKKKFTLVIGLFLWSSAAFAENIFEGFSGRYQVTECRSSDHYCDDLDAIQIQVSPFNPETVFVQKVSEMKIVNEIVIEKTENSTISGTRGQSVSWSFSEKFEEGSDVIEWHSTHEFLDIEKNQENLVMKYEVIKNWAIDVSSRDERYLVLRKM